MNDPFRQEYQQMKEGDNKTYYDSILQAEAYRIQLFSDLNQSAYNTL